MGNSASWMMSIPPRHASIAVVPGCVVIEPIECLIYTYVGGYISMDIEEAGIHSEAKDLAKATLILSEALSTAYACLSKSQKRLTPCLKKKKEFLDRHLKQAT